MTGKLCVAISKEQHRVKTVGRKIESIILVVTIYNIIYSI